MGISQYLKEIGRGARGAKPLDRAQAADLFGQVLDGQVTDLEIGAFCIAMRIKGETADEMCGFLDAVHARLARVP
ncbi:MAG: DNA-binding protein YbiB, partial [Comamonadaceae bacterium]